MLRKLPIIGVFGSGSPIDGGRAKLAQSIGAMVASIGAHLLTGAGYGIMAAVAEGYVAVPERAGFSIGIVPRAPNGSFDEPNHDLEGRIYPNPYVEIAIRTPLPPRVESWRTAPARNHVNVLTADAIVALPGSIGTNNELEMAVEYYDERNRLPRERRTVLIGPAEEFTSAQRDTFVHAEDIGQAEQYIKRVLSKLGNH